MSKCRSRPFSITCLALLIGLGLGCSSEAPTAPANAQSGLLGGLFGAADELLVCPSTETHSATAEIGAGGGVLDVGPHRLTIPSGALGAPVTITATAPAGDYVRVEFQPHGLAFATAASLDLSYAHCGLVTRLTGRVAYVDDGFRILELLPSLNDVLGQRVTGRLRHFSSYALAF